MANIKAFSPQTSYQQPAGASMGYVNCQFSISNAMNDHVWTGEGYDTITESISYPPGTVWSNQTNYQNFAINCAGRIAASAGFTLIAGGHFDTSWDAVYIFPYQKTFAYFDYSARQFSFVCDSLHTSSSLTVLNVIRDNVGQRTVIKLDKEIFNGVAKVSVTSNVATVTCYAQDGTTPIVPPVSPGVIVTFLASETSNPLAGLPISITGMGSLGNVFLLPATRHCEHWWRTPDSLPLHIQFRVESCSASCWSEWRRKFRTDCLWSSSCCL